MVVVSIIIVIVKLLNVDSWDVLHVSYDISHYKTSSSAPVCSLVTRESTTVNDLGRTVGTSERRRKHFVVTQILLARITVIVKDD